jgi:hypothetical protein
MEHKVHYLIHNSPQTLISRARWIQSTPLFRLLKIQFIFNRHRHKGLPSGLFALGFLIQTLYAPLLSTIRATRPVHLILLDFVTPAVLGGEYRS